MAPAILSGISVGVGKKNPGEEVKEGGGYARKTDEKDLFNRAGRHISKNMAFTMHQKLAGIALRKGNCIPGICGEEAACFPGENSTHRCVCPSDLSAPTLDLHCPFRRIVPPSPVAFENIIIGRPEKSEKVPAVFGINRPIFFTGLTIVVFFVGCIYWCIRCKGCAENNTVSGSPQPKPPAEPTVTYARNPTYGVDYVETSKVVSIPIENISVGEEVGAGFFGKVFKGQITKNDGSVEIVAIKILKSSTTKEVEKDFMRELTIMSSFSHKNILSVIGIARRDLTSQPWLIFEYMPGGDLAGLLRRNSELGGSLPPGTRPITRVDLHKISLQIAAGMKYLTSKRYVHNDLACRNILVGTNFTVKIADFGMSRDVYMSDYYRLGRTHPLPIRWMAPESLLNFEFSNASDVWSYGIVLWELYTLGKQPYFELGNLKVINTVLQGNVLKPPLNCPSYIKSIMNGCWKFAPSHRLSFNEIYSFLSYVHRLRCIKLPFACVRSDDESSDTSSDDVPDEFKRYLEWDLDLEKDLVRYHPDRRTRHSSEAEVRAGSSKGEKLKMRTLVPGGAPSKTPSEGKAKPQKEEVSECSTMETSQHFSSNGSQSKIKELPEDDEEEVQKSQTECLPGSFSGGSENSYFPASSPDDNCPETSDDLRTDESLEVSDTKLEMSKTSAGAKVSSKPKTLKRDFRLVHSSTCPKVSELGAAEVLLLPRPPSAPVTLLEPEREKEEGEEEQEKKEEGQEEEEEEKKEETECEKYLSPKSVTRHEYLTPLKD